MSERQLPTYSFSQTNVATNIGEILVTFGSTVARPVTDEQGAPNLLYEPIWLASVAMSPQVALQLLAKLGQTLDAYQEMFGPIPQPKAPTDREKML